MSDVPNSMRAVIQDAYGDPDRVLNVRSVAIPPIGDDDVLVRVHAASMHPDVWHVVTGRPYILRLVWSGLRRPRNPVPGTDIAGTVAAVGRNATSFRPGDAVFGETYRELAWRNGGAYAEFVAVPHDVLAPKPANVSFEQAASVPTSGYIAVLNLQNGGLVRPASRVLINGAAGNVGSIAIQLCKAWGAHVTAVDATAKLDFVRELGADDTIDYMREDFTRRSERYDLILDVASNLSLGSCRHSLTPDGYYVPIGHDHYGAAAGRVFGSLPRFIVLMLFKRFLRHLPNTGYTPPAKHTVIAELHDLLETGRLTPVVDRSFPLDQAAEALGYLQSGRATGRIVIAVDSGAANR